MILSHIGSRSYLDVTFLCILKWEEVIVVNKYSDTVSNSIKLCVRCFDEASCYICVQHWKLNVYFSSFSNVTCAQYCAFAKCSFQKGKPGFVCLTSCKIPVLTFAGNIQSMKIIFDVINWYKMGKTYYPWAHELLRQQLFLEVIIYSCILWFKNWWINWVNIELCSKYTFCDLSYLWFLSNYIDFAHIYNIGHILNKYNYWCIEYRCEEQRRCLTSYLSTLSRKISV